MTTTQLEKDYYAGVDLHRRNLYLCVMNARGNICYHRRLPNDAQQLVSLLAPYRPSLAVGVESTYNWYWVSDACRNAQIPFYLGHALYMKALHGSKTKNDRIDARKLADLLRCNLFPLAYAYPREMRATRDLLRRRHRYVALRAEAYTHIQNTFAQQGIVDIDTQLIRKKTTRGALPPRLSDPDLSLTITSDLSHIDALDGIIASLEKQIYAQAQHHDPVVLELLQSIPGVGDMLSLTMLYEVHTIGRFASPQQFSSYCRVVRCAHTSNGKPVGNEHNKIGNPYLRWAFGEMIFHAQRHSPKIHKHYQKLVSKHGSAQAKSILAHKFAVAVYFMLKREEPFDEQRFLS